MPWAFAISRGSLYVLLACQLVLPLSDHRVVGAVPASSIRDTLARAPPAAASLFRSAASCLKAAVRSGRGVGLGLGLGLGSAVGLGVTAGRGLGEGVIRLPVITSGMVSGTTTTMKSVASRRDRKS